MATMPKRMNGFTLIELLIAMVLIAILATIGISRFWSVKDKALIGSMQSDLRNFASLQEDYFQKNYNYAPTAATIVDFVPSQGVTLTVTANAIDGWAATAAHASLISTCGYFTGNATAADAPPATQNGVIGCN
jgi:prepilin-type N-terminal cleavage/methylation domain-containing protein